MNRLVIPTIAALLALGPVRAAAQTPADSAAVRQAALDYIEGYFEGNGDRMERALHPELAKRIVRTDETGGDFVSTMGASQLIAGTRSGGGRDIPAAERRTDVTILDIYQGTASARIDAGRWIDYLHLARVNGRWVIVNVLWAVPAEVER